MKTLCLLLIWREWLFLLIYLLMHKLNSFYKQISNINVKSLKFIKNWFTPPSQFTKLSNIYPNKKKIVSNIHTVQEEMTVGDLARVIPKINATLKNR